MKHLKFSLIPMAMLALITPSPSYGDDASTDGALRGAMAIPPEPEPAAATLDRGHAQEWHRVSFQLYGSMCPACLLELQGKLRKVDGVAYAKIHREALTATDSSGKPHHPKAVETTVICDEHSGAWDKVQDLIKGAYYKCTKVDDVVY